MVGNDNDQKEKSTELIMYAYSLRESYTTQYLLLGEKTTIVYSNKVQDFFKSAIILHIKY